MKNAILFLAVTLISSTTFATNVIPPSFDFSQWERLGSKKVNFRLDRDVVRVGLKEGGFTKLKIQVTGGTVNMRKMVVEYRNGQKETINLRHKFTPRSGSRIIDLNGGTRIIKDITFYYDSVNTPGRKATVHVFGRH